MVSCGGARLCAAARARDRSDDILWKGRRRA